MKCLLLILMSFGVQAQNPGNIDPIYDTNKYDYMYSNEKDGTYVCETLTRNIHGGYILIDCEHVLSGNKKAELHPYEGEIKLISNNTK